MAKLNGRHENYYLKKAKLIKEYASNSYPSVSEDDEKVNNLIITIELLLSYIKQIENLKSKLISNAKRSYMFNLIKQQVFQLEHHQELLLLLLQVYHFLRMH